MKQVLDSTRWVVDRASHVKINLDSLYKATDFYDPDIIDKGNFWHSEIHFFDGTEETVRWIFVLDVLNHSFWPDPGKPLWKIIYKGKEYSGYAALAVSLKRAIENDRIPLTDAKFLANIDRDTLAYIFRGSGHIPMLDDRVKNLREAGRVLIDRWDGDAVNIVRWASNSAIKLVEKIVSEFPSFKDQALYQGKTVYFWKRAQLFVSDLFNAFDGKKWGNFQDIDCLTAFADYKLPQVLRHMGILEYSSELAQKVDSKELLPSGSEEEVEIRSATIQSVELIKKAFFERGYSLTSAHIDNWLWNLGQEKEFRKKPYHLCRTIFY